MEAVEEKEAENFTSDGFVGAEVEFAERATEGWRVVDAMAVPPVLLLLPLVAVLVMGLEFIKEEPAVNAVAANAADLLGRMYSSSSLSSKLVSSKSISSSFETELGMIRALG